MSIRTIGLMLALATAAISGFNVFINGYAVGLFPDATLYTTGKNLVAAVALMVAVALVTRSGRPREGLTLPHRAAQWLGLAAVAAVGGSVPFVLFFEGLARAGATDAAFIQKTLVVWVALLAVPLLKEKVGLGHVAAIALLIAGQALTQAGLAKVGPGIGEAMILAATLLWAVELVIAKKLLGTLSPLTVGVARMGGGVVLLLAYAAVGGHLAALSAAQVSWLAVTGLLLALYVGTWYAAVARAPVVDVTAILVFGAVVTAALGAAVRGATVAPQLGGLALIACGTALMAAVALRRARDVSGAPGSAMPGSARM